ncbi:MAG: radical SAM protein, partial [Chloroflexia bacterium]
VVQPAGRGRRSTFDLASALACTAGLALLAPLVYWAGRQSRLWPPSRAELSPPAVAALSFAGTALYLLLAYVLYRRYVDRQEERRPGRLLAFLLPTAVVGGLVLALLFDAVRLLLRAFLRPPEEVRLAVLKAPLAPPSARLLHYQTPPEAPRQYRLHLRREPDGRGLLVINAATVLHLNPTATEYARMLLQGMDEEQVGREMARRFRVRPAQARADYRRIRERILALATATDLCPVTYLDLERAEPFSAETSAPYRVDIALTYRLDERGTLDTAARRRVERELSTAEWQEVLDRLWEAGVPHVVFTGGEPTCRPDLVELVQKAEALGMVTGLLTDGCRLREEDYLNRLLLAGLDHLQITLASHRPALHDRLVGREGAWEETVAGLRSALAGDIYVVGHVVIRAENAGTASETVAFLADLGVPAVALSSPLRTASQEERAPLEKALEEAQAVAHRRGLTLVWDLAAPYSHVNPMELEAELSAEAVVRQHLYIEPDGDVLPAQGYPVVLGNILRDPWPAIWENPARRAGRA